MALLLHKVKLKSSIPSGFVLLNIQGHQTQIDNFRQAFSQICKDCDHENMEIPTVSAIITRS